MSLVRRNLMNEAGYSPYCGAEKCRGTWPRAVFNGTQFECKSCGWVSQFDPEFIAEYKEKWGIQIADTNSEIWSSPAGFKRGELKGITEILYPAGTPVKQVSGGYEPIKIWGQKTLTGKPSTLDAINMRRFCLLAPKTKSHKNCFVVTYKNRVHIVRHTRMRVRVKRLHWLYNFIIEDYAKLAKSVLKDADKIQLSWIERTGSPIWQLSLAVNRRIQ